MSLRVAIIYIHPTTMARTYVPMARRFVDSYMENPPGEVDHEVHVAINGGVDIGDWCRQLFSPLPVKFFKHNNYGKDIGAYQVAADMIECDLMVCLGAPVYFHRPGWLDRIALAYMENGPTVYGPWGFDTPLPHLRTTAFWLPPELMNAYPRKVSDSERYQFEHGTDSITLWSKKIGLEPLMVTWSGTYEMPAWYHVTRHDSLLIDQHLERNQPAPKK